MTMPLARLAPLDLLWLAHLSNGSLVAGRQTIDGQAHVLSAPQLKALVRTGMFSQTLTPSGKALFLMTTAAKKTLGQYMEGVWTDRDEQARDAAERRRLATPDERIAELEAQVEQLEARVAELTKMLNEKDKE